MQEHSISTVHAKVRGKVGFLTLRRPEALNALDLPMIRQLHSNLLAWASDDNVNMVIINGMAREGGRPAFCAGGDIRFFHRAALGGNPRLEDFFTEEYSLNFLIHNYPKPYIALMDGIVMGGGMGIAQGASVRVVTERSQLAMPETQIGLFPDVGGGWFLSRCPGSTGEYLGLTGSSCGAKDSLALGLADVYVHSERLNEFVDALSQVDDSDELRGLVAAQPPIDPHPAAAIDMEVANRHFSHANLQEIIDSLSNDDHPFSMRALQEMRQRSPLMMAVTLEQIRRARNLPLRECLMMERTLVRNCLHIRSGTESETVEGIRALAIDKDRKPRWVPDRIELITPALVQSYFESPWPLHAHPLRGLADSKNRFDKIRLAPSSADTTS